MAYFLESWLDGQPLPRGQVLTGEAGVILSRDPDSTVEIDVTYVGPGIVARQADDSTMIIGAPVLAVEILSPNDRVEDNREKVSEFLRAGVTLIWNVNPYDHTVTVHRSGGEPQTLQRLAGTGGRTSPERLQGRRPVV